MAQTNEPIQEATPTPHEPMDWYDVWLAVFTEPSVETFERIIQNPNANAQNGYRWVFITAVIGVAISSLFVSNSLATIMAAITVAPVLAAAIFTILFVFNSWIIQDIARRLGGDGDYGKYHYAAAAFTAPLVLVAYLLVPVTAISAIVVNALTFVLLFIHLIMTSFAVRAVNGFSWGEAAGVIIAAIGVQFGAAFVLTPLISIGLGI